MTDPLAIRRTLRPDSPSWQRTSAALLHEHAQGEGPLCAYVYDLSALAARARETRATLPGRCALYYAVKANTHPAVIAGLAPYVDGFEVASLGEINKIIAVIDQPRLIFSGPAKTDQDIAAALRVGGCLLNVESLHELRRVQLIAETLGVRVPVALRINPVGRTLSGTHQMVGVPTQFGIDETHATEAVLLTHTLPNIAFHGFHFHAVSNNLDANAHARFVARCLRWSLEMAARYGIDLTTVNVGGGIGIDYDLTAHFDLAAFCAALDALLAPQPEAIQVVFELGRWLVAAAGWYAAEIVDLKQNHGRFFAIIRGGTHHFRLPAAWRHSHPFAILPTVAWVYPFERPALRDVAIDVAGELCTPRDVLSSDTRIEQVRVGDILVFPLAGAYGWEISHHDFLSHPHPVMLVVDTDSPVGRHG
ncbi:MAG: type III PLP-dependent enzyme [Egibacteraceae bacterium]